MNNGSSVAKPVTYYSNVAPESDSFQSQKLAPAQMGLFVA
jgi:hypothetical protein